MLKIGFFWDTLYLRGTVVIEKLGLMLNMSQTYIEIFFSDLTLFSVCESFHTSFDTTRPFILVSV